MCTVPAVLLLTGPTGALHLSAQAGTAGQTAQHPGSMELCPAQQLPQEHAEPQARAVQHPMSAASDRIDCPLQTRSKVTIAKHAQQQLAVTNSCVSSFLVQISPESWISSSSRLATDLSTPQAAPTPLLDPPLPHPTGCPPNCMPLLPPATAIGCPAACRPPGCC